MCGELFLIVTGMLASLVQGDTSGCSQGFVAIKIKVVF